MIQQDRYHQQQRKKTIVIGWIERILKEGLYENRRWVTVWVLAPYLLHPRNRAADFNTAFNALQLFMYTNNKLRPLNPMIAEAHFHEVIEYAIKHALDQQLPPILLIFEISLCHFKVCHSMSAICCFQVSLEAFTC